MISEQEFNKLQYGQDPKWNPWFLADDDTYRSRNVGARLSSNTRLVDMYFETIRRTEPKYSDMTMMELINHVGSMKSIEWDEHTHGKIMNDLCIQNKVKRCMKNIFVYIAKTKSNEKCTYESIEVKDIKCGYNYSFKDIIQQIMYKIECHIPLEYLKFVQFKKPKGRKRKKTDFSYRFLNEKYHVSEYDLTNIFIELIL